VQQALSAFEETTLHTRSYELGVTFQSFKRPQRLLFFFFFFASFAVTVVVMHVTGNFAFLLFLLPWLEELLPRNRENTVSPFAFVLLPSVHVADVWSIEWTNAKLSFEIAKMRAF
jgi:hypothetical protein